MESHQWVVPVVDVVGVVLEEVGGMVVDAIVVVVFVVAAVVVVCVAGVVVPVDDEAVVQDDNTMDITSSPVSAIQIEVLFKLNPPFLFDSEYIPLNGKLLRKKRFRKLAKF
jgi:uncharacterized membrane protein required for colicin V production